MATSGGDAAGVVAPPAAQYDKFGFLVAADRQERVKEYRGGRKRRSRSRDRYNRRRSDSSPSPLPQSRRSRRSPQRARSRQRSRSSERAPPPLPPPPPPPPPQQQQQQQQEQQQQQQSSNARGDSWEAAFEHPPPPPPAPYISGPPSYAEPTTGSYPMDGNYGQFSNNYNTFTEVAPPPTFAHHVHLNQDMSAPLPTSWSQLQPGSLMTLIQDDHSKKEAIASELRNQCVTLGREKGEYIKKLNLLKKELETLKEQKSELRGNSRRAPSPNTLRFLKENSKLQTKLQDKIKTINNVIDMLDGIIENIPASNEVISRIGDKTKTRKTGQRSKSNSASSESSSSEDEKHTSRRRRKSSGPSEKKFNFAYYDPEMHWCRACNEFPVTAKDYLMHLHTPQHQRVAANQTTDAPWHTTPNLHEGFPTYSGAPIKRTPIKGLQFFTPSTAWYCKLCDQWIGDLHCASAHLKSLIHSQNYTNFIELNPHWEMDFMSDRQKSFEKAQLKKSAQEAADRPQYSPHTISFHGDGFQTKSKKADSIQDDNVSPSKSETKKERKKKDKKEKKKKKKRSVSESSSSSSSSSESPSESKKTKSVEPEKVIQPEVKAEEVDNSLDDRLINQWMSVHDATSEQDLKMFEDVKNRVKSKAVERTEQRVDGRVVSREREARALLSIRNEKVKTANSHSSKYDNNDKEKEKDHRSHRDKERDRDRDRRSDRSHRRDRDDSDDDRKYKKSFPEKRYIMDTEFKPYPSSKRDNHDHNESRFDKQVSKGKKKSSSVNKDNSNSNDSKKMPFIGKMPLYKSLGGSKSSKGEESSSKSEHQDSIEVARKKRDEINAHFHHKVELFKEKFISTMAKKNEMMEGHFPEPKLIIPMGLHGHQPLLDISEMMIPKPVDISSLPQTIHRIQPTSYSAPAVVVSPTAKQVIDKNNALHKDFQDALDIIFPSDTLQKKDEPNTTDSEQKEDTEQQQTAESDDMEMLAAQSALAGYQTMTPIIPGLMSTQGYMSQMASGMIAAPPAMGMVMGYDYTTGMYDQAVYDMGMQPSTDMQLPLTMVPSQKPMMSQDMEDLAMLGIDAEDVGASGF